MTMTEEEARKKWCPFVRNEPYGFNRTVLNEQDACVGKCVASECMAFRWAGWVNGEWGPTQCSTGSVRVGYCGLAGAP